MPINRKYPIEQVLEACRHLGRMRAPLTLEYMLINGINDSLADALRLADMARSIGAKVNLIPCNPVLSTKFQPPPAERMLRFQAKLREAGVLAFIRRSRGEDIEAACGQLRASAAQGKQKGGKAQEHRR